MRFRKTSLSLVVCLLPGLIAVGTSAVSRVAVQSPLEEAGSEGCGRMLVYAWDQAGTTAIVVEVDQRMV